MKDVSLFEQIQKLRIQFSTHASDLYIPVNAQTQKLISQYEHKEIVTRFISQIDKKSWFDIPFAYKPWWDAKCGGN